MIADHNQQFDERERRPTRSGQAGGHRFLIHGSAGLASGWILRLSIKMAILQREMTMSISSL